MTKIIGLTGGIGTGKSTVSEYLKRQGFHHIDADQISRDLTKDGSPMLAVLNDVFGPEGPMGKEGYEILNVPASNSQLESNMQPSLNRQALADLVFTDPDKRDKLNEIMITEIIKIIDELVSEYRNSNLPYPVLLDAPLLFEAGLDSRCDMVLLIISDMDVRIDRVCSRDGISPKQVKDRINNQMSDQEKISRADEIVDNSKTLEDLYRQLDLFIKKFK